MPKSDVKIDLGDLARDRITGYKGIVVAKTEWLNGCVRVTLQAQKLDAGKVPQTESFDVEQVEVLKVAEFKPSTPSGGPMPTIKRNGER